MKTEYQTHDLSLPAWGPYTKLYSGVSHIPAANDGVRFDLSVVPGLDNYRTEVPNVCSVSGYHVWAAAPDLSCYTMRHEMLWKDQVYADVSFAALGENARLVRVECCNRTQEAQELVLHALASAHDPTPSGSSAAIVGADVRLPTGAAFVQAKEYDDLRFAVPRPTDSLGWDGMRRAEEFVEGFSAGYGVGAGFGCAERHTPGGLSPRSGKGDTVVYTFTVEKAMEHPCLCVRYVNRDEEASGYELSCGGALALPHADEPAVAYAELPGPVPAGAFTLTLTAEGTGGAKLDCLALCESEERGGFSVTLRGPGFRPVIGRHEDESFLTLQYPHIRECYAVAWAHGGLRVREIPMDRLDFYFRFMGRDYVSDMPQSNGKGHFTDLMLRPVRLEPGETRVVYGVVCCADTPEAAGEACRALLGRSAGFEDDWRRAARAMEPRPALPAGEKFALGQQLMQAVLCTNVVYPVYTRSRYIRHNTPGRIWDSLYTWDSGFTGMGLLQFSESRAAECLNAYLTPPGDDETAFIHHGSMVPTQFYLFAELLNRTCSRELAESCYPRLAQYYAFLTGRLGSSTLANLRSGLLRPWDYFYNSGGWDDYPPQKAMHEQKLEDVCAPVVTTSHAARCARILAYVARLLDREDDAAGYDADAGRFAEILNAVSWDEESGYFGYVMHDENGEPTGIFRHESGVNYNMGLGGASPLFAGACTPEQAESLWAKLEDDTRIWSACGLSTVDQSAPYFSRCGYWNGAVWMPYQWMFFKTALDAGKADFAFRIADTALNLWQKECAATYQCYEHFMIESRRGSGWHQFGALSAPVVQWFSAYYVPGTLTTGFDTFVREARWSDGAAGVDAVLDCTRAGRFTVLAASAPVAMNVSASAPVAACAQRHDGLWEITLDVAAPGAVELKLSPCARENRKETAK